MNQRAITITITLFVLLVAGMFIFAYLNDSDTVADAESDNTDVEGEVAGDAYSNIELITAKHFYIDGVHTLAGEVAMPTPCDLLEAEANVQESDPEQIQVEFNVVNNAEFCAEVVTPARFMVSAEAGEEATFDATFEGRAVELNLVEAEPGETPEEYELYIKG